MIKAVIFDMDGVIIDSEPLHYKVFMNYAKSKFGLTISDEEYSQFIGTSNHHLFLTLQGKYHIAGDLTAIIKEYEDEILGYLLAGTGEKPILGVDVLVKNLHHNKIKLAVASSSTMKVINIVLDMFDMNQFFDAKASGEEVEKGKPAPDVFLLAAERLNICPEECLVFEDSRNGVMAAKAAGMLCIGFYNPNSGEQDLSRADKIIENFAEVDSAVALAR